MPLPVRSSALRAIGRVLCFTLAIGLALAVLDPPLVRWAAILTGAPSQGASTNVLDSSVILLRWIDVVLVMIVMLGAARLEHVPMGTAYGLPWRSNAATHVGAGMFAGVIAVGVVCGALVLAHALIPGSALLPSGELVASGVRWAFAFLAVAALEELLFRGYALSTLARGIGFWPASVSLSLLFTAAHIRNAGETGMGLTAVFLFGMLFCAIVQRTGALWLGIGIHAGWDWAQSFLFGVPDSGTIARGRAIAPTFSGFIWLTGGTAGPEGSAITIALLLSALLMLTLPAFKRRREITVAG